MIINLEIYLNFLKKYSNFYQSIIEKKFDESENRKKGLVK